MIKIKLPSASDLKIVKGDYDKEALKKMLVEITPPNRPSKPREAPNQAHMK